MYLAIGVGLTILWYYMYKLYKSKDTRQVKTQIKKFQERPKDIFTTQNYELAKETSSSVLTNISDIVVENYGKVEIEEMLTAIKKWKEENDFKWDNTTLYDELMIEGVMGSELTYNIKHQKNTKSLKIKGILEVAKEDEKERENKPNKQSLYRSESYFEKEEGRGKLYTISGIDFFLTNVYPDDIGKAAVWSISVNEENTSEYSGVITNREYISKADKSLK